MTRIATPVTQIFGIDLPIFGFSHSREVVAAVTKAGGMGVLGAASYPPERLDIDLRWIARQCGERPFGVDLLFPIASRGAVSQDIARSAIELTAQVPARNRDFIDSLVEEFGVPPVPALPVDPDLPGGAGWRGSWALYPLGASETGAREQCEIALRHGTRFLVSALGPPPPDILAQCRRRGIVTGAMVGSAQQARRQKQAGVDIIIAQGSEAAAHTGEISTMVLVPQVVEAVHPTPVLAAGGVGSGAQMAAALALGAAGVWAGSIWLISDETDEPPEVVQRLLAAGEGDTVRSRSSTGKPLRQLRSGWTEAWERSVAPPTLPMPFQHLATLDAKLRFDVHQRGDLTVIPVGQLVGNMNQRKPCAEIMEQMSADCLDTLARLASLAANPSRM